MALPVIALSAPMVAGALGFGGGFLASKGTEKIVKLAIAGVAVYFAYQHYHKGKV